MHFGSDNWAGAHQAISAALAANSGGFVPAYGASEIDRAAIEKFNVVFGREVSVFFVGTGTAANALALSSVNRPGGVSFCAREAHVIEDECGAPEFFTGGARLHPVDGPLGKIDPDLLRKAIAKFPADFVHHGQPMAVTITQATEAGTIYSLDEIGAISTICREAGIPLHMDGARFANALVSLGVTAAEMTAGVDMVSFGGTKNGCWCAEALVVLDPQKAGQVPFLRKRGAQLFSKSRFIAAQFDAYLNDDLWLEMAAHANAMAARLAGHVRASPKLRLGWEPEANEVFIVMGRETASQLEAAGARFYPWSSPQFFRGQLADSEILTRFVTSFATTAEDVDAFGRLCDS
ncbi:MAG TPA: low specificity L-threonine aldolase [Rhizobiaceae bacterium]|nr:low specificity L-threonine aldolase [Rhizobiaceae bacterium]